MEKQIFDLKLSVEAVSLYLLIEGLKEKGDVSMDSCKAKWNADEKDFNKAYKDLQGSNIVQLVGSKLMLVNSDQWITKKD